GAGGLHAPAVAHRTRIDAAPASEWWRGLEAIEDDTGCHDRTGRNCRSGPDDHQRRDSGRSRDAVRWPETVAVCRVSETNFRVSLPRRQNPALLRHSWRRRRKELPNLLLETFG